jgi:hypothetical protein
LVRIAEHDGRWRVVENSRDGTRQDRKECGESEPVVSIIGAASWGHLGEWKRLSTGGTCGIGSCGRGKFEDTMFPARSYFRWGDVALCDDRGPEGGFLQLQPIDRGERMYSFANAT